MILYHGHDYQAANLA